MAYLPLAPYDEGDALQALLCDGSDGDSDLALFGASWGADAPLAGTPAAADFRCLEPEHGAACMRCAAGPVALCKNRHSPESNRKCHRATAPLTPSLAAQVHPAAASCQRGAI